MVGELGLDHELLAVGVAQVTVPKLPVFLDLTSQYQLAVFPLRDDATGRGLEFERVRFAAGMIPALCPAASTIVTTASVCVIVNRGDGERVSLTSSRIFLLSSSLSNSGDSVPLLTEPPHLARRLHPLGDHRHRRRIGRRRTDRPSPSRANRDQIRLRGENR